MRAGTEPVDARLPLQANAMGRNSKATREYLEKNYELLEGRAAVKLVVKALMETVEVSGKTGEWRSG